MRAAGDEAFAFVELLGAPGAPGAQGERGPEGPQGLPGEPGPEGPPGETGLQGDAGPEGPPGPEGQQGDVGAQGARGPAGPQGLQGEPGEQGPPGEAGPEGLRGDAGPEGPQGRQGEAGPQGLRGDPGPIGVSGSDGRTILNGMGEPDPQIGSEGDFYLDTITWTIYGPKNGTWGWGSSIVGPPGEPGPEGAPGDTYYAGAGIDITGAAISLRTQHLNPACPEGHVPQSNMHGEWQCGPAFGDPNQGLDGRGSNCVLGEVWLTASNYGAGVIADGRILPVSGNEDLFALLGNNYGGNPYTTFALPDLRQVAPRSANGHPLHYVICTDGDWPRRN